MWCSLRIARSTLARQHEYRNVFVSAPLAVVSFGVLQQLLPGVERVVCTESVWHSMLFFSSL